MISLKQKFPLHTFDSNFSINEALETIYELECMFREFGLTNFCAYIDSFGKLESYKIYNVI